jgi:hypothetical protein
VQVSIRCFIGNGFFGHYAAGGEANATECRERASPFTEPSPEGEDDVTPIRSDQAFCDGTTTVRSSSRRRHARGSVAIDGWCGATKTSTSLPAIFIGTQSTIITVTHEGVRLRLGAIDRWYSGNPRLSGLSGEKLIVRFNQDVPQWIVATHPPSDPKATAPFIIEASPYLPAMAASKGELRKAGRQRNLFHNFGRAIHREILRHGHLIPILEPTIVPELNNSGESINAEDAPRMPSRIRTF